MRQPAARMTARRRLLHLGRPMPQVMRQLSPEAPRPRLAARNAPKFCQASSHALPLMAYRSKAMR